jgi:beta-galactosidase/beta-glucuronidase
MKTLKTITAFLLVAVSAAAWAPVPGQMLSPWGEKVTPENAWREYPRPAFVREGWQNLNGLWQYAVTPVQELTPPQAWPGQILVPFALEAPLSGVGKALTSDDALWYKREFTASPSRGKRTLLHFEAVDYKASVWVNGKHVGEHIGGNLPFSFDVSSALKDGKNLLVVRVLDATDGPGSYQLHGKQVAKPGGIWYTSVSGIWQTVWLEQVPDEYLAAVKLTPKINGEVAIELTPGGGANDRTPVTIVASLNGKEVATVKGPGRNLRLSIPQPQLWSPETPTLYDLAITYGKDMVRSYIGLRETTIIKDAAGHLRFALNGREVFHFGPLDQGWWPDGLLTPPSEEAMRSDLVFLKAAGFNTVRKHIKVEPRRFYTDCDRMGLLVWQDQVSSGTGKKRAEGDSSPKWVHLEPNPPEAVWPDAAHAQYMAELKGMMDALHNHPSIVQWLPFNEAWGQHRTVEVGNWTVAYDPTRQVNAATGGNFFPTGHIVDEHRYPHPDFPFNLGEGGRFDGFVKVVGEFGGHGFPVEGHLWSTKVNNWGYGGLPKDKDEWLERYKTSMTKLAELRRKGIAAGIYTQTTDVEGEINGLITYDRKVQKLSPAQLSAIHREAGFSN